MITIRQTLSARLVRQVAAVQPPEPRADTVRKLHERYKFMKVPVTLEELFPTDLTQGIKFEHGTFERDGGKLPIIVELLQLLPNVIVVQTKGSTDEAEEFLEDYVGNANKERPTIEIIGPPFFASSVEFSWDRSLDAYAQKSAAGGPFIDKLVASYGAKVPPYRVTTILLNFDQTGLGGLVPAHFSLERRAGLPDSANIFFSHAPLKTRDHHALLEYLDRL